MKDSDPVITACLFQTLGGLRAEQEAGNQGQPGNFTWDKSKVDSPDQNGGDPSGGWPTD